MPKPRKPLKEGQFKNIRLKTHEKYLKIGLLYFCQNFSYKDLEEQGYGTGAVIAAALKYFANYFEKPDDKTSLIGAITSTQDRLKWLKADLAKLRSELEEKKDSLTPREKTAYFGQISNLSGQITKDEELLYKLQGVLEEKVRIEGPEEIEDDL